MDCPNCGRQTAGEFCTNCGTRIPGVQGQGPVLGGLIRGVMLLPHYLALCVLFIGITICQLFLWVPVLFTGEYPTFARSLVNGTIRWSVRIHAFAYGLTDVYPPFSLGNDGDEYPIKVTIVHQQSYSRFFAIPVVGYVVKGLLLIPHVVVLYVLFLVANLLSLFLWIPVLFGGRYPDLGYRFIGGTLRWWARYSAYWFGVTDQYPRFQLAY